MLTRPKTEIQSKNLEEIAKFAAEDAAKKYHRTVVVEDSGLFVRKLNGFPGPFSSYVYATVGCEGLLQLMNRGEDRDAYFQASLAVATPRRLERTFTGKTYGTVSRRALGTSGFGFDPIFVPKGTRRTFAQGGVKFKDRYSHRAEAFRQLAVWSAKTDI
jgi:XTP/dITP diphosphohydrolase